MLAALGFAMVLVFMLLVMSGRVSALVALVLVPALFACVAGFAAGLGPMVRDGLATVAPTAAMLMFAILYFGVMADAGLFEPVIRLVVRLAEGDPLKVVVGTAALALFVSLDGDGSTTYIITTSAMLPLYRRLRMCKLVLASVVMQASGAMNLLPWGGPAARAASALKVDVSDLFNPMVPALLACAAWVVFVAYFFGLRERWRLGFGRPTPPPTAAAEEEAGEGELVAAESEARRPGLIYFNLALTAALMAGLLLGVLPLPALFLIALAVALLVNYPSVREQKERLAAHSANALAVGALIFAAGVFMGVLSGTGMVDGMAHAVVAAIPQGWGPYLAPVTGLLSIPLAFFLSNDAFYFGVLPVLAEAAGRHGISPAQMGRAALVGQPVHLLSPMVASTYLLVWLVKAEFGEHQRFTLGWSLLSSLVLLAAGLATAAFPLQGAG